MATQPQLWSREEGEDRGTWAEGQVTFPEVLSAGEAMMSPPLASRLFSGSRDLGNVGRL